VETNQSQVRVALTARTRLLRDGEIVEVGRTVIEEPGFVAHDLTLQLEPWQPVTVEKIVALYTSRDRGISECGHDARLAVARAPDFAELLSRHQRAWLSVWNRYDIEMDSANEWTGTVLHLHIFHLLQTVSPRSTHLDVGVPVRGWRGEAYRGHIFWDELFIFPYINFQRPWLAAALLEYRYARLGAARAAAREAGFAGAMFPWQSGSNGREETQRLHLNPISGRWLPDRSHVQRHVNIAIAYNVWQHDMVTGSLGFLRFTGTELLIEIARFWASIATCNSTADRYEINGVMGPDEYHDGYPGSDEEGLRNNTYTNVMTVWVLQRALEALQELPPHHRQELVEELVIRDEELERWRDISRKMTVVFHVGGVLSQFEGYAQLPEFDWNSHRDKYGNIQRLDRVLEAEGDSTNRYKVSKQADVPMLLYLLSRDELRGLLAGLGYEVSEEQLARTVDYYLARTTHGSTLSSVATAWILAGTLPTKLGDSCSRRCRATSLTYKAALRRKAFTSGRWPARWIWCCAASPACAPMDKFCDSIRQFRQKSNGCASASTIAATASSSCSPRTVSRSVHALARQHPSLFWCVNRPWSCTRVHGIPFSPDSEVRSLESGCGAQT
jgi:trehalose/maltose hydrolase-like predicted phosphorylase